MADPGRDRAALALRGGRTRAWLEAARLSNLPTALSNVLVGLALGYAAARAAGTVPGAHGWASQPWHTSPGGPAALPATQAELLAYLLRHGAVVFVAVACLYAGGMMLNDVADVRWDRAHRRERPIPSGRLKWGQALAACLLLLGLGVLLPAMVGLWPLLWAATLLAAIIGYNLLHKYAPWAVVLMGVCRGLIYLLAASALASPGPAFWRIALPPALLLSAYVVMLTVVARMEHQAALDRRRWLALLMIPLVLAGVLLVAPRDPLAWLWVALTAAALAAWLGRGAWLVTRRPPRTGPAVLTWLAGICLIDAYFLTLMALPLAALIAVGCWLATVALHRRIAGT